MTGHCHCANVVITLPHAPPFLYDCNCTLCRKSGGLWGYFQRDTVLITGGSQQYRRQDRAPNKGAMHFCGHCGSTLGWLSDARGDEGLAIINMRLFDPAVLGGIPLEYPDGANWQGQGPFGFRAPASNHGGISH
jgi:hypothetical protein